MSDFVESTMDRIHEALAFESDSIGLDVVADIQESINTSVWPDGFGEGNMVRSPPGRPPYKEFGNLQAATHHEVKDARDGPVLRVINDAQNEEGEYYGDILENIGVERPSENARYFRPFFAPAQGRWEHRVGPRLLDSLGGLRV